MTVDFFLRRLASRFPKSTKLIMTFITLCFFTILLIGSWALISRSVYQLTPITRIPMAVVHFALPVSIVLMAFETLAGFWTRETEDRC